MRICISAGNLYLCRVCMGDLAQHDNFAFFVWFVDTKLDFRLTFFSIQKEQKRYKKHSTKSRYFGRKKNGVEKVEENLQKQCLWTYCKYASMILLSYKYK